MSVTNISSQKEFEDILLNNENVIIEFYTDWCPPCKQIAPIYEHLATAFPKFKFLKVNLEHVELIMEVQIWGYPSFVIFQNGLAIEKVTGASIEKVEDILTDYSNGKEFEDGIFRSLWRRYGF